MSENYVGKQKRGTTQFLVIHQFLHFSWHWVEQDDFLIVIISFYLLSFIDMIHTFMSHDLMAQI